MRIQILSGDEVQVFLSYLDKLPSRDNLLLRLMLQCGLRCGEVSALNVEHVWRDGYVHPAVNVVRGTTKGHKGRFVDIPGPLVPLIRDYMVMYSRSWSNFLPSDPLFRGSKRRSRLGVSGIGRIVSVISLTSLGRRIHPHVLRHTYATVLLKHTNIRVVQQLLGHARVNTTQIYTHVSSEDCKNAVNHAFDH